jgi:putative ABC transport system ATP-binding protein
MGPSGSGKTTLLSIAAGVLRATEGQVFLCGQEISRLSEESVAALRRKYVGFIFQGYNLFPALTALDNVAIVLKLRGAPRHEARATARAVLDRVGMGARANHRPEQLSGGEKQRVAIARAFVANPTIILGDEITAALDGSTAFQVMTVLCEQMGHGTAAFLVTHDRRLERFADRVIELEDGLVASDHSIERSRHLREPNL